MHKQLFFVKTTNGVGILKNTGVIRRVDELGRIVIPKEIRRNLGIREGECLEFFINNDQIILQKQMLISSVMNISQKLISIICDIYKVNVLLSDRQEIVVANIEQDNLIGTKLSGWLLKKMDNREKYISNEKELLSIGTTSIEGYFLIRPIIMDTDVIGIIIIKKDDEINENDHNIIKLINNIIISPLNI